MSNEEQIRIISKNLTSLLKERDINQRELSEAIGVTESAVGKWILGHNAPSMGSVQKIANFFRVPKSRILEEETTEEFPPAQDENLKIVFDAWKRMTDADRQIIANLAQRMKDEDVDS